MCVDINFTTSFPATTSIRQFPGQTVDGNESLGVTNSDEMPVSIACVLTEGDIAGQGQGLGDL
jgi:hypothetical protein